MGIILAFLFKDNRAFCKYICPVTIFLKPMSYFSVVGVKCDKEKCISCGKDVYKRQEYEYFQTGYYAYGSNDDRNYL